MGATNSKGGLRDECDEFAQSVDFEGDSSWYGNANPVDSYGCRKFLPLPPPGHLSKILSALVKHFTHFKASVDELDNSERQNPTEPTIRAFFKIDESRNTSFLGTYIYAFIERKPDLMEKVRQMVVFYARIVTAAKRFALANEVTEKPFAYWHCHDWDVSSPWLVGGTSVALLYDLMFEDMDEKQRNTVRESISVACAGRKAWGMNSPARCIQSNWAPYNSQLYVMLSAIEGEVGNDDESHACYENLLAQYMDHAIHPSGHPIEDAYALNLGFREGSYSLVAMARRGFNLYHHPHFKPMWTKWLPFALEPQMCGDIYGGSSGSHWHYPTFAMITKYMFPRCKIVDFVYKKYMFQCGNPYQRMYKFQARLPALIFAPPANDEQKPIDEQAAELDLPLTFRCANRGKVIMRSDWTTNALWYTLDARPDAFFIGHDSPSRGSFSLSLNGRAWAVCPEWYHFRKSEYYSLPTIDGVALEAKAPFVRLFPSIASEASSKPNPYFAAADLTYAYNWTWTQWQNNCPAGYEAEPHNPREFGMSTWWLPAKINGERNVGFVGLHQWRKRFNDVRHVTRSALMVPGPVPYIILADVLVKDDDEHQCAWVMTTPADVDLQDFDGRNAILRESGKEGRRLLVRYLGTDDVPVECTFDKFSNEARGVREVFEFGRLKFSLIGSKASFRFMVYGLQGESVPTTVWEDDEVLRIEGANSAHSERVMFSAGEMSEETMKLLA